MAVPPPGGTAMRNSEPSGDLVIPLPRIEQGDGEPMPFDGGVVLRRKPSPVNRPTSRIRSPGEKVSGSAYPEGRIPG